MAVHHVAHAQRRRSKRIEHAIPLTVQGADVYRSPYLDHVSTEIISCHGCRYQSKYDVLPGDRVFLEVNQPDASQTTCTFRGRVKSVQRLIMSDRPFEVGVEFENPGNIWGLAFPPEDWFPVQEVKAPEPGNGGGERAAVRETKPQIAAIPKPGATQISALEKPEAAASLSPLLAQLVSGLGEQIQVMASQAAATAILQEKSELLADFRARLQGEANRTLAQVIASSKDELMRGALKDLKEAHEALARASQERWSKKIEQDLAIASEGLTAQGSELSQRIDGMAVSTLERLQRHMEALRRNAMDQFLARLRKELGPLLEAAESTLQRVAACKDELEENSEASRERFRTFLQEAAGQAAAEAREKILQLEKQFESSVGERLTKAHEELNKESAVVAAKSIEAVRKLSQDCTKTAHNYLQSLAAPTVNQITRNVKDSTAEIARQFASELEESTRRYFESISELMAEIPKKTSLRPRE